MELVDCHTHTVYSDGASTLRGNIEAALAAGLTTIACTDHLAHPAYMDCAIDETRTAEYAAEIETLREEFPHLEIVRGFEADWYPGCDSDLEEIRRSTPFILGSIHYLGESAIDWDEDMRVWEAWGADGVWQRYADAWCEACFCPAGFDSMAHPDLPRLFSASGYAPNAPIDAHWDRMAEAAREAGVRVEISTAGLRKAFADFYPEEGLLHRFHRAGVPITVGSDAHEPMHIGYRIADAYAYAARVGYRLIDVPRANGDWRSIVIA